MVFVLIPIVTRSEFLHAFVCRLYRQTMSKRKIVLSSAPSQKDIVELLMEKTTKEPERRDKISRNGIHTYALFHGYRCPKCGVVKYKEITAGPTNPYKHLRSCYGDAQILEELYHGAVRQRDTGKDHSTVKSWLKSRQTSPRQQAIISWLQVVIEKSLPISLVEDPTMRSFCKHDVPISAKYIKDVIFQLVPLVEAAIAKEMAKAPIGAIMHDGWSKVSTHYFALYACYNRQQGRSFLPTTALLAMSPLPKVLNGSSNDSDVDEGVETSAFNAETHASYICRTFAQHYDTVDFDKWCVAQVCDNASVNRRIAQLLDIKHVGCKSHQLALDVKDMFRKTMKRQH